MTAVTGIATGITIKGFPIAVVMIGVSTITAGIEISCSALIKKYNKKTRRK